MQDTPAANKIEPAGSHFYYSNESALHVADYVNAPGYIFSGGTVNDLKERYSCYTNALVV
jgi:hypothetical protein